MDVKIKDIPGYEGLYAATEDGRIWSYRSNKFLKGTKQDRGYLYVHLNNQMKESEYIAIHRLIALTYLSNPNNYKEVNHKDENKLNNAVDNLEWCSREYNMSYGTARDRMRSKQIIYHPTQKAVLCIETGQIYHSTQEASRQTGINNTSISKVCNGHRKTAGGFRWKFVEVTDDMEVL